MGRQPRLCLLRQDGLSGGGGAGGGHQGRAWPATRCSSLSEGKLEPTRALGCAPGVTSPNEGHRQGDPGSPPLGLGLTVTPPGAMDIWGIGDGPAAGQCDLQ